MFSFRFGKKASQTTLVLYAGTESVVCAFVSTPPQGRSTIIDTEYAPIPFEERTPAALHAALIRVASEAPARMIARTHVQPRSAMIVLGAPLAASRMGQARTTWDHDELITADIIKRCAADALAQVTDLPREDLFEAAVMRVELNGYPARKPEGQRAHECAVSVIASATSARLRADIAATISRIFPGIEVRVRSAERALITVALDSTHAPRDYVALDLGGEGTSISVVRKGVLVQHERIDAGERTILGKVHNAALPEETLSLIGMAGKDLCSDAACTDIAQSLAKAEPELAHAFGEVFARLAEARRLPTTCILVARQEFAPWLQHFFTRIDFAQFVVTGRPLEMRTLDATQLDQWIDTASRSTDIHGALASALVHIESRDE